MTTSEKFAMKMNLNVLNHLGLNLYSNIPAVLSEVVSNAWDADATEVKITINNDKIIIADNGSGMDVTDINEKYLKVGYQKRDSGFSITPVHQRPVMGRKGIGKLSLFSIAQTIEIHSYKDGEKNGFVISAEELTQKINKGDATYHPTEIDLEKVDLTKNGTQIILTDLKKRTLNTAVFLKKRLARRFSVIGSDNNFEILVNEEPITIADRDYFHKLEHIWTYTDKEVEKSNVDYPKYCNQTKLKGYYPRSTKTKDEAFTVHGWIGTVANAGDLKDEKENLNKIVIMVRGKLAQEDILDDFSEGGLYSKYIIGEIHADFLDLDEKDDIATSSRQKIIEDDPRYVLLKEFIYEELKNIQTTWTKLRKEEGTKQALQLPAIKNWFGDLKPDHRKKAESLFGKINQLTLDNEAKKDLFKHSVLAFESFRYKANLEAFDIISAENIEEFGRVFSNLNDIEATLYHQIIVERLKVIEVLVEKVSDNALEKVLQKHLYTHLWLLDPSWDRATEIPHMEQRIAQELEGIELSDDEKLARFDIKYKKSSGKHIIIELKRASVKTDTFILGRQVQKYLRTLRKVLKGTQMEKEPIEIICIVGQPLKDWEDDETKLSSIKSLEQWNARVVLYDQLINDAQVMYKAYLEQNHEAGRVTRLIQDIDQDPFFKN